MKGDFARDSFHPALHYSRVFQQQGRVLLEADWNEQAAIQLHLLRSLAVDLVGPCWAAGGGFSINTTDTRDSSKTAALGDWRLSAGHFYVDGILCENDAVSTLSAQPFAPTPAYDSDGKTGFENAKGPYALWLDVWERHLSSVEAPAIADVALNGVDTGTRAQVVWQLRLLTADAARESLQAILNALQRRQDAADPAGDEAGQIATVIQNLKKSGGKLNQIFAALGGETANDQARGEQACEDLRAVLDLRATYACPRLRAQLQQPESADDPCLIAADARYRGCENQLYRVEIHETGLATGSDGATGATFKWSRENGSVIFPVIKCEPPGEAAADGSRSVAVTLGSLGRDARLGLAVGDWVELLDDDYTLAQRACPLLQVSAIDAPGLGVTLSVPKNVNVYPLQNDPHKHPLLRRWDQSNATDAHGVLEVIEGAPIDLEDGIQISFEPGGLYATGDYWQIPARVAGDGTLLWPRVVGDDGKPTGGAVRARGLHHYAVLGGVNNQDVWRECCCRITPLCQPRALVIAPPPEKAPVAQPKPSPAKPAPVVKPTPPPLRLAIGKPEPKPAPTKPKRKSGA